MLYPAKLLKITTLARRAATPFAQVLSTVDWMSRIATQRRALRTLDDHQLEDIGITRADALREASRPFWDVPHRTETAVAANHPVKLWPGAERDIKAGYPRAALRNG